jgi:predicted DNA-binding transcriptional regulator AlpA
MSAIQHSALLTEVDLSKHLSVSLATLRRWRLDKRGPQYIKVGALVRYRPEDVESWLASRPVGGSPCGAGISPEPGRSK